MMYDLSNYAAICTAEKQATDRANHEPNQSSYNAGWLHGYARALADVRRGLDTGTAETSRAIVECFEDLLELHDIIIPDDDRPEGNDTPLYGCTYGDLLEQIKNIL
jgi:hypothetical protein